MPEYAGQCWMAAAKCEQDLDNKVTAVDYLIRGANAFVLADNRATELFPGSNTHEHIAGAVRCYNDALSLLEGDSAMSAGIIRKLKEICPNTEISSQFHSPTHRIYDLENTAQLRIQERRFLVALDQLTEIFDIIQEEKTESSYEKSLAHAEISILLILLLLRPPPGRQSPIHMKILNKFSADNGEILDQKISQSTSDELILSLQNLNCSIVDMQDDRECLEVAFEEVKRQFKCFTSLPSDHRSLLEELENKYLR